MTMTLNPHALPFFPTGCGRNNVVLSAVPEQYKDKDAGAFKLLDLPDEASLDCTRPSSFMPLHALIVWHCLQLLEHLYTRVPHQRDAASLACTSRRLRALSRTAALIARILPLPKLDFDELKASSEGRLTSLASSFPGACNRSPEY